MSQPHHGDSVADLLTADRELSDQEMERLRLASKQEWATLSQMLRHKASATYAVADVADFEFCVTEHMDSADWAEMVVAGVFQCPTCSRLLKDRGTPVASAILLERRRVRDLWEAVEAAAPDSRENAMTRFRRGLGLA